MIGRRRAPVYELIDDDALLGAAGTGEARTPDPPPGTPGGEERRSEHLSPGRLPGLGAAAWTELSDALLGPRAEPLFAPPAGPGVGGRARRLLAMGLVALLAFLVTGAGLRLVAHRRTPGVASIAEHASTPPPPLSPAVGARPVRAAAAAPLPPPAPPNVRAPRRARGTAPAPPHHGRSLPGPAPARRPRATPPSRSPALAPSRSAPTPSRSAPTPSRSQSPAPPPTPSPQPSAAAVVRGEGTPSIARGQSAAPGPAGADFGFER